MKKLSVIVLSTIAISSLLSAICLFAVATGAFSQVVLDQTTITKIRQRDLLDVQIIFRPDDTIAIRGTVGVTILDGTTVIRQRSLATIELAGTNLASALSTAGLPTENLIRGRFRTLFHTAWTNKLGVINVQGSESE